MSFHFLKAQVEAEGCDFSGLYTENYYDALSVILDVKYGENTTIGGTFKELYMDIYEPDASDISKRPLVILAFGGSFVSGSRQNMASLCEYFASRGYIAATIDYRLYDRFSLPDTVAIIDEVVKAVSDMKAAIRFFKEDAATANLYNVDTNFVFIGGISAGAILASHAAYIDESDNMDDFILNAINENGGYAGNSSDNTEYSTEVQAVLNYAGALYDVDWMDANDPPVFAAHDDQDNVVPFSRAQITFDLGFTTLELVYMEGSKLMIDQADQLGLANDLIVVPNSTGHVSFFGNNSATFQDSVRNSSARFLHNIMCKTVSTIENLHDQIRYPETETFPNPTKGSLTLRFGEALSSRYNVQIIDPMGRIVYERYNLIEQEYTIHAQDLPTGVYTLNVQFEDYKIPNVQHRIVFN